MGPDGLLSCKMNTSFISQCTLTAVLSCHVHRFFFTSLNCSFVFLLHNCHSHHVHHTILGETRTITVHKCRSAQRRKNKPQKYFMHISHDWSCLCAAIKRHWVMLRDVVMYCGAKKWSHIRDDPYTSGDSFGQDCGHIQISLGFKKCSLSSCESIFVLWLWRLCPKQKLSMLF